MKYLSLLFLMIGLIPEASSQMNLCDSIPCFIVTDAGSNPFEDSNSPVILEVQGKQNVSKLCHDTAMSFGLTFSKSGKTSGFKAPKELSFSNVQLRQKGKGAKKLRSVNILQSQSKNGSTFLLMSCN